MLPRSVAIAALCVAASLPIPAAAEDFIPIESIRTLQEEYPFICANWDQPTQTCDTIGKDIWLTATRGTNTSQMLINQAPDVYAMIVAPFVVRDGAQCIRMENVEVQVMSGPEVAADARQQMKALIESMLKMGEEICTRYVRIDGRFVSMDYLDGEIMDDQGTSVDFLDREVGLRVAQ